MLCLALDMLSNGLINSYGAVFTPHSSWSVERLTSSLGYAGGLINVSLGLYMYMYMHIVVVVEYRMFSNVLAEQKAVQSRQLGICGSQLEAQQKFRKLRRLIRVRDEIIGNKMVEFSLVVEAPVRGYHAYMDQWEAAINTSLFFEVSMTLMKGL